ncbi:MAG: hypothetical protein R3D26_07935 [Cyanobacteriota/Melainabacteria group bacterium]
MSAVNADMSLKELLQLVADNHHGKISLSDDDKTLAVGLLKSKGIRAGLRRRDESGQSPACQARHRGDVAFISAKTSRRLYKLG